MIRKLLTRKNILIAIFSLLTVGLFVLALVFIFTDSASKLDGANVVVVYSQRANTRELDENARGVIERYAHKSFQSTFDARGELTYGATSNVQFVLSDGNPQVIEVEQVSVRAQNSVSRTREINNSTFPFLEESFFNDGLLRARHPEVNVLGALGVASDLIRTMDGTEGNYILLMEPGVTTAGNFNMRTFDIFWDIFIEQELIDETLERDPTRAVSVAKQLAERRQLPDLTDITVVFGNLGSFAGAQSVPPSGSPVRDRLIETWTEIIELAGGTIQIETPQWGLGGTPIVHIPDYILQENPLPEGQFNPHFVSAVFFPAQPPVATAALVMQPDFEFTAEELGFFPNLDTFRSPEEANLLLGRVASVTLRYLQNHPDRYIYIVGSVARVNPNAPASGGLSRRRADRVSETLLELAGEHSDIADRIIVIGAECTRLPWRNANERNADGSWNEEQAMKNRVVAVFSSANAERVAALRAAGFYEVILENQQTVR